MKPYLKWAGSKFKVAEFLIPLMGPSRNLLVEPFVGGGGSLLKLAPLFREAVAFDVNPDLIDAHRRVTAEPEAFLAEIHRLFTPANNTVEAFSALRAEFNAEKAHTLRKAALFLYLNKHCFNGLTRYSAKGGYNVPYGRPKSVGIPREAIHAFAVACANVEFQPGDFSIAFLRAGEGSVVYCDPPYLSSREFDTAFTAYSKGGFGLPDHRRLVAEAEAARARGATVLISNHATPETEALYASADAIAKHEVRRSVAASGAKRGHASELVAIYRP